jgi:hypothetical protein
MNPKRLSTLLLVAILTGGVSACGWRDDVQDTAKTVDESVMLLQDIEDSATWTYLSDGLEELDNQGEGYALRPDERRHGDPARTIRFTRVDADEMPSSKSPRNDQTRLFVSYGAANDLVLYRVEMGVTSAHRMTGQAVIQRSPASLFDAYAIRRGADLSVVERIRTTMIRSRPDASLRTGVESSGHRHVPA